MSYINEIEFDLTVGAQYELGPAEMSYLISRILTAGGKIKIEGDTLIITEMPGQDPIAPAPVELPAPEPEPTPEPKPEPEPEPTPEPEPIVEVPQEVVQEATPEVVEPPIKRARKSKVEEPVAEEPVAEEASAETAE